MDSASAPATGPGTGPVTDPTSIRASTCRPARSSSCWRSSRPCSGSPGRSSCRSSSGRSSPTPSRRAIDAAQKRTGRSRLLIVVLIFGSGHRRSWPRSSSPSRARCPARSSLLIRSGPDALETALRQLLGGDSITIGDRTVTVEELATQAQAAINAFLQTPEGAIRAVEQLLHGTLDVDPRDDRDLLPAARRRAVREHPAPVPPAGRPGPDADRRRPDPRGRRAVAARPADPHRVRVGDRVDRPRADPPSAERAGPRRDDGPVRGDHVHRADHRREPSSGSWRSPRAAPRSRSPRSCSCSCFARSRTW